MSAAEQTGRVLGPASAPAVSALDGAFDVVKDALRRLAAALAIVAQRNARPWESATLAYDRLQAAGALNRLVALLVGHVELAAMALRQAETIRNPLAVIEAAQVTAWADGWAAAGDVLAGVAPEMVVTDGDDGLDPVLVLDRPGRVVAFREVEAAARELEEGGEYVEAELVRVSPERASAYLPPRPMLACDEPPVGVAGDMPITAASVEGAVS